jgi:oxygen-independent coproporphyrinogen-3 oxidase
MESNLPAHSLSESGEDGPCRAARDEARSGLYVHVPFCATRCTYCDFSSGSLSAAAVERYLDAMTLEIERRAPQVAGLSFHSVFFGGGTPSALAPDQFRRLWSRLKAAFAIAPGAEITLEANPESALAPRLEAWAEAGVNRLSMGAQSFHPDDLAMLGRIHDAARPREAMRLALEHGFERLSLDLMFGFPGATGERLEDSVSAALECGVEHLSAYCFIPEPGTPLGDAALGGATALPAPERQAEDYARLTRLLERAGLRGYETSNFCRPGAEARHNLVYWLRRPYLGLGPSAHSLIGGERFANHYALARWAADLERGVAPESERERETAASAASEIVMLGLRLGTGVQPADHDARTWWEVSRRYGAALEAAVAAGRLERSGHGWRVPPAMRFVADEAIAWVLARERSTIDSDATGIAGAAFDTRAAHSIMGG